MAKKLKEWVEGELISTFKLERFVTNYPSSLMEEWLTDLDVSLQSYEQIMFDKILAAARIFIDGWREEDLKMNFISPVLHITDLFQGNGYVSSFEKTVEAEVDGIFLKTKTDFTIAKGVLDYLETPYFHFQEYKPAKNPSGDVVAQLLEAMMIAQELNANQKPIYGLYILGRNWTFVIMEGKNYYISNPFVCTEKEDLLSIIGILRKFRHILKTRLLV